MKTKEAFKRISRKAGKGLGLLVAGILATGASGCTELGRLFCQDMGRLAVGTAVQESVKKEINPNQTNIYVGGAGQRARHAKARASGRIHKVWVDHNIHQNGQIGMMIHARFNVFNNQGYQTRLSAYFCQNTWLASPLKDKDGLYAAADGQVAAGKTIVPSYQNIVYNDFSLFFPYSQLDIRQSGKHNLALHVKLWDNSGRQSRFLARSPQINFTYTK